MKKIKPIFIISFIQIFLNLQIQANPVIVDGYAASVNGKIITKSDVRTLIKPIQQKLMLKYTGLKLKKNLQETYNQGLITLVEQALIVEEFDSKGAVIPARIIDERINDIIYERFDGNRAALMEALLQERVSLNSWRENIRKNIIVTVLRNKEISSHLHISPRSVQKRYEKEITRFIAPAKVHLQIILINRPENTEKEKIRFLEISDLRRQALEGKDFGSLAKIYSEGSKADKKGDWGWRNVSELHPEIKKAVEKIDPGNISEVLIIDDFYYIVKVIEKKRSRIQRFPEVEEKLRQEMLKEEEQKLFKAWIARLKKKFPVKFF